MRRLLLLLLLPTVTLATEFTPTRITSHHWDDYQTLCRITVRGILPDGTTAVMYLDGETDQRDADQWWFMRGTTIPVDHPSIEAAETFGDWAAGLLMGEEWMFAMGYRDPLRYGPWVWERLDHSCGEAPACAVAAPQVMTVSKGDGTMTLRLRLAQGKQVRVDLGYDGGWHISRVWGRPSPCESQQLNRFLDYTLAILAEGCATIPRYTDPEEIRLSDALHRIETICEDIAG